MNCHWAAEAVGHSIAFNILIQSGQPGHPESRELCAESDEHRRKQSLGETKVSNRPSPPRQPLSGTRKRAPVLCVSVVRLVCGRSIILLRKPNVRAMMNVEDEGVSNVDLGDDKEELVSTLDLGSNEKEGVSGLQLGDVKEEGVSTVDLGSNKEEGVSGLHPGEPISPESPSVDEGYQPGSPSTGSPEDEEEAPPSSTPAPGQPLQAQAAGSRWVSALDQFKMKRFFVLRPGTLTQAIEDITALVDKEQDGAVQGLWLMAEVDHWNNERERVVVLTDRTLLVCKYDFVMLNCERIHRIPLNCIDRISHGDFSFPKHSLLTREGDGVRVFWDRLREPSFVSRWNPFAVDYPYMTFTDHPVRATNDKFSTLCDVQDFRVRLKAGAEKALAERPVPGKANGVLLLNQPLLIEAYVGLMAMVGNQNKLGYCLARGHIGL